MRVVELMRCSNLPAAATASAPVRSERGWSCRRMAPPGARRPPSRVRFERARPSDEVLGQGPLDVLAVAGGAGERVVLDDHPAAAEDGVDLAVDLPALPGRV